MDIRNLIGEATEYDKKEALEVRKPKSWCKSVSAFANGMGGALIFGITDLDEMKGLQDAEGDAEKISEQIKTRLNPIPNFRLRFEEPEAGKKLIVLDVYPGEQTPYYYDADGGLINLLQDACGFVRQHSHKAWKKTADSRVEMPDYPERAVTEGIVNALIHRNYLEVGSEVHIDIFDDRLEIYSPGGMYDGTKVQERDLMNVPSKRRNPVIADIFSRLKYMDRRGSGFKKILGEYESQPQYAENLKPIFNSDNDAFFLVLKNLNYDDTAKKASGKKRAAKSKRQKQKKTRKRCRHS